MKNSILNLLFLSFVLIVLSCGKDEEPEVTPVLSFNPTSLLFNADETATVSIAHSQGRLINWEITSIPAWLSADKQSGQLNQGQNADIVFTPLTDNFPAGKLSGVVEISWDQGQRRSINVTVCVDATPSISLSRTEITLDQFSGFFSDLIVRNTGTGVLNFDVLNTDPDLFVNVNGPKSLDEGEESFVSINYNMPVGQAAQIIETSFIITSNDNPSEIEIPVRIIIEESASLFINFFDTDFGLNRDMINMEFINDGNVDINFEIIPRSGGEGITVTPQSGFLPQGDAINVEFALDRTVQDNGWYSADFEVLTDVSINDFIFLSYQIYNENKILLDGRVSDAEYGSDNFMYIAQEFPNQLIRYNGLNETIDFLSLPFAPIEVSLSPGANHLVVSGLNQFSVIDLSTFTNSNTISNGSSIESIAIDDNGNAYVFSGNSLNVYNESSTTATTIDLGLSQVTSSSVHPNGTVLYAMSSSSSECLKFNLMSTPIEVTQRIGMQSNPENDFWFTSDGGGLVTQTGNLYNLQPDNNSDVIFQKRINIADNFLDLDYSSSLNLFTGVLGFIDNYDPNNIFVEAAYKFRASDCSQENAIDDFFFVVDQVYGGFLEPGVARYVGINEDLVEYIIVGSTFDTGPDAPWAITKLPIE